MPGYRVEVTEEAKTDLSYFAAHARKLIVSQIREQLTQEPLTETRNRKKLRENALWPWELRIGKFRVFYEVGDDAQTVTIVSVGSKDHNRLYIRGKEVQL